MLQEVESEVSDLYLNLLENKSFSVMDKLGLISLQK